MSMYPGAKRTTPVCPGGNAPAPSWKRDGEFARCPACHRNLKIRAGRLPVHRSPERRAQP